MMGSGYPRFTHPHQQYVASTRSWYIEHGVTQNVHETRIIFHQLISCVAVIAVACDVSLGYLSCLFFALPILSRLV